jgi:prolyl-tRNA synthetase
MKDLYSFHSSQEDLDKFYENMKKIYQRLFKRCGLESLITEASGGTFSKYSHEFQVLSETGEDLIFHCSCGFARNKEIADLKEDDPCPECGKKIKLSHSIEVGNIFKLGTKYSEPFDLSYKDEKGEKKLVIMGCYGIGLGRVMGAIAEIHHDQNGIIWPEIVSPFDAHLISILPKDAKSRDRVEEIAKKLYNTLSEKKRDDFGYEVLYDNRTDVSAGEKLVEADLLGIPWRIVVSEKTVASGKIEIKKRDQKTAKLIKPSEVYKIKSLRAF